jgi:N-glycosylase/DNA lyase
VRSLEVEETDWHLLNEEDLLYEVTICLSSSQMLFELAVAIATSFRTAGLLNSRRFNSMSTLEYEGRLRAILSEPLLVNINGNYRQMRPRFKNRIAKLLSSTVETVYGGQSSLRDILLSARSPRDARGLLIEAVAGFGPKQASMYLRRIGFCSELAILDTHILDYLKMSKGINPKPSSLSKLLSYETIESEFQRIAADFSDVVGRVDLAIWITMRVAKREGML